MMKLMKTIAGVAGISILLSGCGASNTLKGSLIGAGGGGALGAGVGALIGKGKGAAIGAAVGVAVGTTAGALIGRKMDKAKAAAAAAMAEQATVETTKDQNGLEAVKVTLDNGVLFAVGKAVLQPGAKTSLKKFATEVLNVYADVDVAIQGYASSDGSDDLNLKLSQDRANAVKTYLTGTCRVNSEQIRSTVGYGEDPEFLVLGPDGKEDRVASRRVEIYLYASQAMIDAANAGTLQ